MTNAEGVVVGGQLQAVTGEKGGNIGVSRVEQQRLLQGSPHILRAQIHRFTNYCYWKTEHQRKLF